MGGDERSLQDGRKENKNRNEKENRRNLVKEYLKELYDSLLELGYLYNDLYDMTLYELENTLTSRRRGLAYEIWRIASFTHSPFVKNFPDTPKKAMPELFPKEKGIPMPDFLKEKALKRGVFNGK